MIPRPFLIATIFAASAAFAGSAHATSVALTNDGIWHEFTVDNQAAPTFGLGWIDYTDGSPLSFTFSVAAGSVGTLTVVDGGFAGDTFAVTNFGSLIGQTGVVAPGTADGPVVLDYNAALLDPTFSHGSFRLGAGQYAISGLLLQSVTDAGVPLNSTVGAVQLSVAAIPEPSTWALLLAGIGAIGFCSRRRAD